MCHETAISEQKNQIQKFQLSFALAYFLSFKNKNAKIAETQILWCFSKPKKEIFQNLNLKHRKQKKPFLQPFLQTGSF